MNITIKINTDNVAFQDFPAYEVAKILQRVVDELKDETLEVRRGETAKLRDSNGNVVGTYEVTK